MTLWKQSVGALLVLVALALYAYTAHSDEAVVEGTDASVTTGETAPEANAEGTDASATTGERRLTPAIARKATLALSVAEYGEKNNDPYALVSAARMFADLDGRFARRNAPTDEDAKHPEQFYDAGQLLEMALRVAAKKDRATENAIKPSVERVRAIAGDKGGWGAGWHRHYRCVAWDYFNNCVYWEWIAHCHRGFC